MSKKWFKGAYVVDISDHTLDQVPIMSLAVVINSIEH